jgi:hypothetical protein
MSQAHKQRLVDLTGTEVCLSINLTMGHGFAAVIHGVLEKQSPSASHGMFEIRVNSGDEHAYGYAWVEFSVSDVRRIELRSSGSQRPTIWLSVVNGRKLATRGGPN